MSVHPNVNVSLSVNACKTVSSVGSCYGWLPGSLSKGRRHKALILITLERNGMHMILSSFQRDSLVLAWFLGNHSSGQCYQLLLRRFCCLNQAQFIFTADIFNTKKIPTKNLWFESLTLVLELYPHSSFNHSQLI